MLFLYHTWLMFLRNARGVIRMPGFLFLSAFNPIIWMLLFSQLFGSVKTLPGFEGRSYAHYLAPGIAIMAALFGSVYNGLSLLGDMHSGVLDRFLVSPLRRGSLIAGPLVNVAFQTLFQAGLILIVGAIMGAAPSNGFIGSLCVLVAAMLLGTSFGAISNGLAIITKREQALITAINLVSMPFTFLSSMMMPKNLMPQWMRMVTVVNPIEWAVTAARSGFEGAYRAALGELLLLTVFAGACCFLATSAFHHYRARV